MLVKTCCNQTLTPSVKMMGAPQVYFSEGNGAPRFTSPEVSRLEPAKTSLMPHRARAFGVSGKILVWWEIPQIEQYSGVMIYRSSKRLAGDFSEVGEKIYEGPGTTNSIDLWSGMAPMKQPNSPVTANLNNSPSRPAVKHPMPSAPGLLGAFAHQSLDGGIYFIDSPPLPESVYTYTLYGFDSFGQTSYPVVVNATAGDSPVQREIH